MCPSPRIFFRHPQESDRAAWLHTRRASRALHEPWEPAPAPGFDPFSDQGFDFALSTCNQPDRQRFLVFCADTQQLVAQIGLSQIFRGPFNSCVMGYWGSALTAGQGFVAAGVRHVVAHCFDDSPTGLALHRVEANIIPENLASIRIARSAGMILEGFSPNYLQIAGSYRDHLRFAITRERWIPLSPTAMSTHIASSAAIR